MPLCRLYDDDERPRVHVMAVRENEVSNTEWKIEARIVLAKVSILFNRTILAVLWIWNMHSGLSAPYLPSTRSMYYIYTHMCIQL